MPHVPLAHGGSIRETPNNPYLEYGPVWHRFYVENNLIMNSIENLLFLGMSCDELVW